MTLHVRCMAMLMPRCEGKRITAWFVASGTRGDRGCEALK